jgi:hypothetical protein
LWHTDSFALSLSVFRDNRTGRSSHESSIKGLVEPLVFLVSELASKCSEIPYWANAKKGAIRRRPDAGSTGYCGISGGDVSKFQFGIYVPVRYLGTQFVSFGTLTIARPSENERQLMLFAG